MTRRIFIGDIQGCRDELERLLAVLRFDPARDVLEPVGESWELRIAAPQSLARFLAYKGSVTVNGVSLTVNRVADSARGCELSINLIPHTVQNTALHTLTAGGICSCTAVSWWCRTQ